MSINCFETISAAMVYQASHPGSILRYNGSGADVLTGADIPAQPAIRDIAPFDFINRFLPAERAACLALAYNGTGNTTAADILLQTQSASVVHLDGDKTISSMAFWVVQGCITAARSLAILS